MAKAKQQKPRKPRGLRFTARVLTRLLRLLPVSLAASRLFKAKVVNRPTQLIKQGPVIVAANHRSFSDPIFIWGALRRPAVFVAMAELWKWPIVGWVMRLLGHIPVDRKNPDSRARVIEFGQHVLESAGALIIFPEGKMHNESYDSRDVVAPLFDGVARLAFATNTPVLVCGLRGTSEVYPPEKGARLRPRNQVSVHFAPMLISPREIFEEIAVQDLDNPTMGELKAATAAMMARIEIQLRGLIRHTA